LGSAGELKALMNLANPVTHSLVAAGLLLTPAMVQRSHIGGVAAARRMMWAFIALFLGTSSLYLLALWSAQAPIVRWLYGGAYAFPEVTVILVGLLPIAATLTVAFGCFLRAVERPDLVFWAYLAAALAALLAGIPLVHAWETAGVLLGLLVTYAVSAGVMLALIHRSARQTEGTLSQA
jgi:O-antigen/teichoic acid export membrane protein